MKTAPDNLRLTHVDATIAQMQAQMHVAVSQAGVVAALQKGIAELRRGLAMRVIVDEQLRTDRESGSGKRDRYAEFREQLRQSVAVCKQDEQERQERRKQDEEIAISEAHKRADKMGIPVVVFEVEDSGNFGMIPEDSYQEGYGKKVKTVKPRN